MPLSDKARVVLAACQLDADQPVAEIAKRTGLRPHVVRTALQAIERSGTVRRVTYVDVYPLGFRFYGVYFSFSPRAKSKTKVLNYLRDAPNVSFLANTGGELEFNFDIVATDPSDVLGFLDELSDRFDGSFGQKGLTLIHSLTDFNMKFLAPKVVATHALGFGRTAPRVTIDELDHRILSKISVHAEGSTSALARSLGVKQTTVQYRLQCLKERNIICGTRYIPNLMKLGFHVWDLLVRTSGMNKEVRGCFLDFCSKQRPVYAVLRTSGEWDYHITAASDDPQLITELVQNFMENFSDFIIKISTQPVVEWLKISFYPFKELPTSVA